MEPTETFTATKEDHAKTELTYRDTTGTWGANDLFSLLEACSNWGSLEGMRGGSHNVVVINR